MDCSIERLQWLHLLFSIFYFLSGAILLNIIEAIVTLTLELPDFKSWLIIDIGLVKLIVVAGDVVLEHDG